MQETLRLQLPHSRGLRLLCAAVFLIGWCTPAAWAAEARVPYVPTPQEVVDRMLQMAKVGAEDYLIDLGSGDGRIVVTAASKYGARGFGVDINPVRLEEANENAQKAGVTDRVTFHQRDLFETDLSEATVITMYLLPRVNLELRPKLLELRPGTRLVSHDFSMEDWKPDDHVRMYVKEKYGASGGESDIYFWVVPAKAAGRWQWELTVSGKRIPYEVTLTQQFQMISGTARIGGRSVKLQNARLRGDQISFTFAAEVNGAQVKHDFTGRVAGDSIVGDAALSGSRIRSRLEWDAKRAAPAAGAAPSIPFPFLAQSAHASR
ncbi:MAG: class I SAM-dependent methyltransferase [Burkholderiales bacterium]|nr:class I SAM-dependent methyltransferase [Burkholderiales bacterium]